MTVFFEHKGQFLDKTGVDRHLLDDGRHLARFVEQTVNMGVGIDLAQCFQAGFDASLDVIGILLFVAVVAGLTRTTLQWLIAVVMGLIGLLIVMPLARALEANVLRLASHSESVYAAAKIFGITAIVAAWLTQSRSPR